MQEGSPLFFFFAYRAYTRLLSRIFKISWGFFFLHKRKFPAITSWSTSVAVLAVGMAELLIDAAPAASRRVALALREADRWDRVRCAVSDGTVLAGRGGVLLTFGPQRACLVTQQISVLHIRQQSQSQPSFFWTMTSQRGHFMASPFCSMFCGDKCGIREVSLTYMQ